MLLIIDVKNFMCLIFAVWLNYEAFLPSKLLQTTICLNQHIPDVMILLPKKTPLIETDKTDITGIESLLDF